MINFNEYTHTYELNNKQLISVTTLLAKHGLSTNYDDVDPQILANKAEFGKKIHKELELYLQHEIAYEQLTDLSKTAIDLIKDYTVVESETKVYNDLIAGTMDLLVMDNNTNELILMDFKTTYNLNVSSVSWQLSLYAYLYGSKIEKLKVIWLDKSINSFIMKDIEFKPLEAVERLIECERLGVLYKETLDIIPFGLNDLVTQTFLEYDLLKKRMEELEKQKTEFTELIKVSMKEHGVKSFENEWFKITYVEPQVRTSYDYKTYLTKKNITLTKEELEEIKKETHVKDSVRITIKE